MRLVITNPEAGVVAWVNAENVVGVEELSDGCRLHFTGKASIDASESVECAFEILKDADHD